MKKQSQIDNFFGSIVGFQNALLSPLAPFGRKLQQNDWQTNWLNTNNPVSSPQMRNCQAFAECCSNPKCMASGQVPVTSMLHVALTPCTK